MVKPVHRKDLGGMRVEMYALEPSKPTGLLAEENLKKYIGGQLKISNISQNYLLLLEIQDIKIGCIEEIFQIEITPAWVAKCQNGLIASEDAWKKEPSLQRQVNYLTSFIIDPKVGKKGELEFHHQLADETLVFYPKQFPFLDKSKIK